MNVFMESNMKKNELKHCQNKYNLYLFMFSLFMKTNCDGGMKNKTRVNSNLRGMNQLIYERGTGWMEDE